LIPFHKIQKIRSYSHTSVQNQIRNDYNLESQYDRAESNPKPISCSTYRRNYFALSITLLLKTLVCCIPVTLVSPMMIELMSNTIINRRRLQVEYQETDNGHSSAHRTMYMYRK
jgi:hypothetical protein